MSDIKKIVSNLKYHQDLDYQGLSDLKKLADRIKELEGQLEEAKGHLIDLPITDAWILRVSDFLESTEDK